MYYPEAATKTYPRFIKRKVNILDGFWDFSFLGENIDLANLALDFNFDQLMPVPGAFDASPAFAGKRGTVVYRCSFRVDPDTFSKLYFHGLGIWCRIIVDGQVLNEQSLPYSNFSVIVPPSAEAIRELCVVVDNRFDEERSPLQEQYFDFYAYGGIFRSVELHELPDFSIERAQISTLDIDSGSIKVRISFIGNFPKNVDLSVSVDNHDMKDFLSLPINDGIAEFEFKIPKATVWTCNNPVLHEIHISKGDDDIIERFGLRTIEINDRCILLNGEAVKLLGFCRHEAHPQFGPALPDSLMISDLQILKDLNCNFIRGAHYPQNQRFLDLCDEMGFLVMEESLGWQQDTQHFKNPEYIEHCIAQTVLMAKNSFNHPSVLFWGFLNESSSHKEESRALHESLVKNLKEIDQTRPISFASCQFENDINMDLADIICINMYPGWYSKSLEACPRHEIKHEIRDVISRINAAGHQTKPFILSEIGIGAIYGWHDSHRAHWSEEYQADCLMDICSEVIENNQINGLALWQFCDCRTADYPAKALNRPRSFNNKGILDEYRRPKMAYNIVKDIFGKIKN